MYNYIDFNKDSLYQRLVIIKEENIIGSIEPVIDKKNVKYLYSDFNFDKDKYYTFITKSDCPLFEIDGLEGDLWCVKNKLVFKVEISCLKTIKLISSSKYIAKNYGADFINDLINYKVKTGKYYLICE